MKCNTNVIKDVSKYVIRLILGIISAISIVAIATLIILNSTWIYNIMIDKYNLVRSTGVAKAGLIKDYSGLIKYLENPFIDKLHFENFVMSPFGEVHFYEVKRIFIALIAIVIIFVLGVIVWIIFVKTNKYKLPKNALIKNLNLSSNILGIFFVVITACYFINFSWAFTVFHKIFFRNDYWIFDPAIDPIILALPEEFFMLCAGLILGILLISVIAIKWAYYKKVKIKSKNIIETNIQA